MITLIVKYIPFMRVPLSQVNRRTLGYKNTRINSLTFYLRNSYIGNVIRGSVKLALIGYIVLHVGRWSGDGHVHHEDTAEHGALSIPEVVGRTELPPEVKFITYRGLVLISYQFKLIKMSTEFVNLNDCAVPILSRAAVNILRRLYLPLFAFLSAW